MDKLPSTFNLKRSGCSAPWDSLEGSDSVRVCSECQAAIFRIETTTEEQILKLANEELEPNFERICLYKRNDGTFMLKPGSCGSRLQNRLPFVFLPLLGVLYYLLFFLKARFLSPYSDAGAYVSFGIIVMAPFLAGYLTNGLVLNQWIPKLVLKRVDSSPEGKSLTVNKNTLEK